MRVGMGVGVGVGSDESESERGGARRDWPKAGDGLGRGSRVDGEMLSSVDVDNSSTRQISPPRPAQPSSNSRHQFDTSRH